MTGGLWPPGRPLHDALGPTSRAPALVGAQPGQETHMQWDTPQALDIRLGFEITMYVAAR